MHLLAVQGPVKKQHKVLHRVKQRNLTFRSSHSQSSNAMTFFMRMTLVLVWSGYGSK